MSTDLFKNELPVAAELGSPSLQEEDSEIPGDKHRSVRCHDARRDIGREVAFVESRIENGLALTKGDVRG